MADARTFTDCPLDDPRTTTDVDEIDIEVELLDQVGEYDAFGPFAARDAYPGPA